MGLIEKIKSFGKKDSKELVYMKMLSGKVPIFSQFGENIYASDVVQQAMACIATEIKKLSPMHARENGSDAEPVEDSLQRVLNKPNELMTTADFLEKITWLLFFNYNVFIYPTFTENKNQDGSSTKIFTGLYPLQPTQVDFLQDSLGNYYVKMWFRNGTQYTLPYWRLIHWRYRFSVDELMGGNENGQPDNQGLLDTLKLNHNVLQGISKAAVASYAVNGVVKYNTLLDKDKQEKAINEFEQALKNNASGILPMDLKGEYIPIQRNIKLIDKDTLDFIDQKILRNFGTPLPIIIGDYTKAQYEAFYQKSLEPLIVSLSQAITYCPAIFTPNQLAFGHRVKLYPKELIFMSVDETLKMVDLLSPTGTLYENEKRIAFGMKPLKELVGKRMQSLNWIDANMATAYQMKTNNKEDNNVAE